MRIIKPSYEILTPISEKGIQELKHIERIGRVCYKSEDKITEDGESAKKFVQMLINHNHLAMIEHISFSVLFTVDRGVTHEMVRHRIASFAQESTRYVNYSLGKFGSEITVILPSKYIRDYDNDIANKIFSKFKNITDENGKHCGYKECLVYDSLNKEQLEDIYNKFYEDNKTPSDTMLQQYYWAKGCLDAEENYMKMIDNGAKAQIARSVLPNSTKANITITANLREWRNIFELRCASDAHPDIRYVMLKLLNEIHYKIPVVFDDLYDKYLTGNDSNN